MTACNRQYKSIYKKVRRRQAREQKENQTSSFMDFNYPAIDYLEDHVTSGPDSATATFLDAIQDLLLFQHVEEPTRV